MCLRVVQASRLFRLSQWCRPWRGAYEVMGLEGPYFSDRNTPLTQADIGRQSFTKALSDFHRFEVPNLRNVALTAPYFHDGSVPTLDDAVKKMVRYQTSAGTLSQGDIDDIVAFLKTLTGKFQGVPLQETPENPPLRIPRIHMSMNIDA